MSRIRTFLALDVGDEIRRRAAQLIKTLRSDGDDIKWVERDNLHITLNFLGDVNDNEVHDVCQVATRAAAALPLFEMECVGVGAFPHVGHPRTIWIGVQQGSEAVCRLQEELAVALTDLGFPHEHRQYKPHLTLGRSRRGGRTRHLTSRLVELGEFQAGRCIIEEVVVYSSILESTGPIYHPLAHVPLADA
ncbi:MAG: RNA 2',3'-cyclic phosphodiesterase [Pirellulaceae bacterium]